MTARETDHLIKMAKQILRNVGVGGDQEAVRKTAEHIEKYWPAAMRSQLLRVWRDEGEDPPTLLGDVVKQVESLNA